jgi:hypothetical protein
LSLSLNPRKEAFYCLELAKGYLERARKALALKDFASTISEAQLSRGKLRKSGCLMLSNTQLVSRS